MKTELSDSDPTDGRARSRWMLVAITAGLVAWGILHAIGASSHGRSAWGGLVVIACFTVFLGGWWLLLAARARRRGQ